MLNPVYRASVWAVLGASLVVAGCAKKPSKEDCAKWTSHAVEVMTKEWNSNADSLCKGDDTKQAAKDVFEQEKKSFGDNMDPMCSDGTVTSAQIECFLKADNLKAVDACNLDSAKSFATLGDSVKKMVKLLCAKLDDQAAPASPSAAASGAPDPTPAPSAAPSASASSGAK